MQPDLLVRPFLKWAGGKRRLVPEIRARYLPKQLGTYYEPFFGGGAVLFGLQPDRAVINDSNAELINCCQVIRDTPDELIQQLREHRQHCHSKDYYYQIRDWDRSPNYFQRSPVERAARMLFLNRTCYNGLYRVNSRGQFNVPFGKYKHPRILDEDVLRAVSRYLNQAKLHIRQGDFQRAVQQAEPGDFIYFDPPYDPVSATSSFTAYDSGGFTREDQIRLREEVDRLDRLGCRFLLSNACTPFILDLYKGYYTTRVAMSRAINSNALKRGRIHEVLVLNYSHELELPTQLELDYAYC